MGTLQLTPAYGGYCGSAGSNWSALTSQAQNGLAFSPDEKFLYVGNWDEKKKVVFRYQPEAGESFRQGGSVLFQIGRGATRGAAIGFAPVITLFDEREQQRA